MTAEEMKAIKMRLDAAQEMKREIGELTDRIECVESHDDGFRFDCDGGGRWLGDSPELKAVIVAEMKRQLAELQNKFSAL